MEDVCTPLWTVGLSTQRGTFGAMVGARVLHEDLGAIVVQVTVAIGDPRTESTEEPANIRAVGPSRPPGGQVVHDREAFGHS